MKRSWSYKFIALSSFMILPLVRKFLTCGMR